MRKRDREREKGKKLEGNDDVNVGQFKDRRLMNLAAVKLGKLAVLDFFLSILLFFVLDISMSMSMRVYSGTTCFTFSSI